MEKLRSLRILKKSPEIRHLHSFLTCRPSKKSGDSDFSSSENKACSNVVVVCKRVRLDLLTKEVVEQETDKHVGRFYFEDSYAERHGTNGGGGKDPQPGVETHLLDGNVGEEAAGKDAKAAAKDGAHCQPQAGIVVGIVLVQINLRIQRPRQPT